MEEFQNGIANFVNFIGAYDIILSKSKYLNAVLGVLSKVIFEEIGIFYATTRRESDRKQKNQEQITQEKCNLKLFF